MTIAIILLLLVIGGGLFLALRARRARANQTEVTHSTTSHHETMLSDDNSFTHQPSVQHRTEVRRTRRSAHTQEPTTTTVTHSTSTSHHAPAERQTEVVHHVDPRARHDEALRLKLVSAYTHLIGAKSTLINKVKQLLALLQAHSDIAERGEIKSLESEAASLKRDLSSNRTELSKYQNEDCLVLSENEYVHTFVNRNKQLTDDRVRKISDRISEVEKRIASKVVTHTTEHTHTADEGHTVERTHATESTHVVEHAHAGKPAHMTEHTHETEQHHTVSHYA